jgi:ATP-binding cassette subfamily B protein
MAGPGACAQVTPPRLPVPRWLPPSVRATLSTVRWAVSFTWTISPGLLAGAIGLALARSTVPAGLALAARGILNAALAEIQSGHGRLIPLLPWLLAGLGFALVDVVAPLIGGYVQRRLGVALELRATTEVLTHASELSPIQIEGPGCRTLLERAREGSTRQLTRLVMGFIVVVTELGQAVLLVAVLFHIEPVALALVGPAAVFYLVAEWRATRRHQAEAPARALTRRWAMYFASLLTGERSANEIRLLGLAPVLVGRFRALTAEIEDAERLHARHQVAMSAAFGVLTTAIFYASLALVTSRAVTGRLTIGDVAVFVAVSARLRGTVGRLAMACTQALEAALTADAVRAFLGIAPSRPAVRPATPDAPRTGGVEVEDVWLTYPGASQPALAGVSLRIAPGEIVALAGPNGAGKTTLIKLLAGLYQPDRGRILVDGQDLRELPFEAHRQRLSAVSQDSPRFEATARDNIAFGDWAALGDAPEAVERVAARAGVDDLLKGLPRGYLTTLGQLFGEQDLSSGQWQRVVLARAQARQALLWLLDEPSAHLDERAERELLGQLRALAPGRAILLVSHRPRALAAADRVVFLERGRVVERRGSSPVSPSGREGRGG